MQFKEMLKKRESVRSYDPTKRPSKEQLYHIRQAARIAPSACNSQPWRFVVVNDGELSPQVAKATQSWGMNKFTSDCPSFIVICEEEAKLAARVVERFARQHFAQMDIGLATMSICFAALEEGMGTCILGSFDENKLKSLLHIKESEKIRLVVCVGYPTTDDLRDKKRKDMDEIVEYFGS